MKVQGVPNSTTTASETGVVSSDHLRNGRFASGNKAGLNTRFVKGQSGNPGGLPKGTLKMANWMPYLCDMTLKEIRKIEQSATASLTKRACARILLDSYLSSDGATRLKALREAMDRSEGKAIERVVGIQMNAAGKRSPTEVLAELKRLANYGAPG